MVYYEKTLEPLHELTPLGRETYIKLLEFCADEILFKHKHPFKYWFQRLRNWIELGDSTWTGPGYGEKEKYQDGFSYSSQD